MATDDDIYRLRQMLLGWGVTSARQRDYLTDAILAYTEEDLFNRKSVINRIAEKRLTTYNTVSHLIRLALNRLEENPSPDVQEIFYRLEGKSCGLMDFLQVFYEIYVMGDDLTRALWKVVILAKERRESNE